MADAPPLLSTSNDDSAEDHTAPTTKHTTLEIDGGNHCHCPSKGATLATLTWKNLTVSAKDGKGNEKQLLKSVTGFLAPKHMLAIMGPSGCGKTTLLDTLAGRKPAGLSVTGEMLLNGHPSKLCFGRSAYVTQDEMLVGTLSVRECLWYTAMLRLPKTMSTEEKEKRAEEVLADMGLTECADTLIGDWFFKGISGGQKRRVSIACELITQPTLLFLDEPTSGLDAASAYFVMATIRDLAATGRTVVTVIHQPSSEVFDLFDKLCLLSRGTVVYFGTATAALGMFEAAGLPCPNYRNPTDHFLHCINEDFQVDHKVDNMATLVTQYTTTLYPAIESSVVSNSCLGDEYKGNINQASLLTQNLVLAKRMFVNNTRNIGVFWLRLGMYIVLCIMMGTIFLNLGKTWKDTYSFTSMMFFVVAFLTFMSIAGFPAFAEDMAVFSRERKNGYYGVSTFVVANTLASAPFIFGIALISSLVVYWLVGLNDQGDRFPYFVLNLYASLTVVESIMMMIAAIVPHYLMGIAGGAGILGMFMLVSGFFQPVAQIPAPVWRYPLHFMAYHSYAFGGFMQNQFDGTDGWGCPPGAGSLIDPACTLSGKEVVFYWIPSGAGTLNKWGGIGVQWGMTLIYRGIFYGVLKMKERMQGGC
ncbi:hypothetical protein FOA52_009206 [Chlamydomonas sp. UWO 241]|nr:hypothetical protein FOA52_009206 [Chlamydomonas sp. UWO 241]